jgi:hypothetical protein
VIAVTGDIAGFRRQLALEMARLDREVSAAYVLWTKRIFMDLVIGTAQWSGNLAANWNYGVKVPDTSYYQIPNKTGDSKLIDHWREDQGIFYAGHPYAVAMAQARMQEVTPATWRDPVFFTNVTPDDKGGYLEENIASGKVRLRPVNLVNGAAVTLYTIAMKESQRSRP